MMILRMSLIALTLFAIPGAVIGQSGQDERAREANRKDTNVFVREAQAGESSGLAPWEIAGRLVGGAFATQQDSERGILENIRAGDEIAFSKAPGTAQMDQAVAYYRQALATAEQQRPPHRPDNMAKCRYRLACGLRQRGLTQYWGIPPRQADLNEAKALFESIVTDFPKSREAPHGYVPRGRIEIDLLGPPWVVLAADAVAARAREDAIYESLRMDYPDIRLWGEDAITGTAHVAPPLATTEDEVVYHLKNRVWARTYGGAADDWASKVQPTTDGGFVVTGFNKSSGAGIDDVWVLKLARDGTVAWQKEYGGGSEEFPASIQSTSDGGYVVAGATGSAGAYRFWVLKLTSDGTVVWEKTYGGGGNDNPAWIQPTTDGGYVVAGYTTSFGSGGYDIWVLKLTGDGAVAWQKAYGGVGQDIAQTIQQTADGGYIVLGYTSSFGSGGHDIWVLKLTGDGAVAWQKTYGGTGEDFANSMQLTSDGGCVIAGQTTSSGAGGYDYWVIKLSKDGAVDWQKTYGGGGNDVPMAVQPTGDGGYIVAGVTSSFGAGSDDFWVLKLLFDGNVEWQKTYGGTGLDQAYSIQPAADGGFVIAGPTQSFGSGGWDFLVLKSNPDGTMVPTGTVAPPGFGFGVDTVATVQDTSVRGVDSTATAKSSTAVVANTVATITETDATVSQQTPSTWSPPRR